MVNVKLADWLWMFIPKYGVSMDFMYIYIYISYTYIHIYHIYNIIYHIYIYISYIIYIIYGLDGFSVPPHCSQRHVVAIVVTLGSVATKSGFLVP